MHMFPFWMGWNRSHVVYYNKDREFLLMMALMTKRYYIGTWGKSTALSVKHERCSVKCKKWPGWWLADKYNDILCIHVYACVQQMLISNWDTSCVSEVDTKGWSKPLWACWPIYCCKMTNAPLCCSQSLGLQWQTIQNRWLPLSLFSTAHKTKILISLKLFFFLDKHL